MKKSKINQNAINYNVDEWAVSSAVEFSTILLWKIYAAVTSQAIKVSIYQ